MSAKANLWRPSTAARHLTLLPAFVVAVSLALTGTAAAQTFQTTASGHIRAEEPCVQTIPPTYETVNVLCGSTNIPGYGPAAWTANVLTAVSGATPACTDYTSIDTFQLLNGGGTLVLDEQPGTACAPGNSWNNPRKNPFGAPWPAGALTANWNVDKTLNTGVFVGATGGGTLTGQWAGPEYKITYTGTLS